ncbi:transposase [Elysia marginata]|uniref:Transposase n=1 Tax=Elysia marginata TaxID=1093978 RepID=A0AAV4JIG8_9GAST|nr:transposase [Elysia marginata]
MFIVKGKTFDTADAMMLILDQHHSHEVYEMIMMAKRENIHTIALPPHTSHWLQPLDKDLSLAAEDLAGEVVSRHSKCHREPNLSSDQHPAGYVSAGPIGTV